ncbi:hypothetical protein [Amycolatopsis sp. H20-H5]|uniref:hypothetical protein n=1 Tax=Amycolatopsis sp. H20-H5 TaxID=3046309 RepID=UPI002DB7D99A|nr:hypothetical protein [Amycolatopsis sp. H20-H5]MEC3977164.1 hypothetical protein [Amycolatopsis sp. H20-H5]
MSWRKTAVIPRAIPACRLGSPASDCHGYQPSWSASACGHRGVLGQGVVRGRVAGSAGGGELGEQFGAVLGG